MKFIKRSFLVLLVLFLAGSMVSISAQEDVLPETELPVLITSCGQSPGANMLKVIFMRLKLEHEPKAYELNMLATAEDLSPYKTLIIVMGASLKGMGAAGISIDSELDRTKLLIEAAKKQGITIVGAHIEGIKRRAQGADVGDNTDELSIDAVAPYSDLLVINKEGDEDSRFTDIANDKNIPMITVEKNLELLEKLGKIFKKSET